MYELRDTSNHKIILLKLRSNLNENNWNVCFFNNALGLSFKTSKVCLKDRKVHHSHSLITMSFRYFIIYKNFYPIIFRQLQQDMKGKEDGLRNEIKTVQENYRTEVKMLQSKLQDSEERLKGNQHFTISLQG